MSGADPLSCSLILLPERLVEDIVLKEQRILEIMAEIRQVLAEEIAES